MRRLTTFTLSLALLFPGTLLAGGEMPSQSEMWRMIQQQQREIQELKSRLQMTDEKAEAAVAAVEDTDAGQSSSGASRAERTQIGGYGELHYNNLDGSGGASDKEEIDFHRFVLFFGHQFSERTRFFSELEVEHAISGDGQVGEVEIEQAYIEHDLNDRNRFRAGLMLLPVGILNETHEPPTFYGVERNPVEKNIIPATWWAGGLGLSGELAPGLSYDILGHEGLKTSAGSSYKVRSGRQKTGKADANDLAATARLRYTAIPGLTLSSSVQYQSDITQGADPDAGNAWLFEAHAVFNRGPFALRALYARWDLDGNGPKSIGADEQEGFYIEPSYKITDTVGVFTRYNQWDNAAGSSSDSEKTQWDVGVNWWLHPDVVLKADYQQQDNDDGKEQDGFNLGVGYQF